MSEVRIEILTRRGCHLCEEMEAVVAPLVSEYALLLDVVDVDTDPALAERFGAEVPVLLINGRKAYKYRVGVRELCRRLRVEKRRMR